MDFLEGTDAVWAVEDEYAKSVINVMVLLDVSERDLTKSNWCAKVLLALRKRLSIRLLGQYKPFPKMFYTRTKDFGFTFWTNEQRCNIEEYIR